ncbi:TPA: hypothetical protein NGU81_003538 [Vibrio parahaemolyticus]|nr:MULTISPECIES: hypothetical protein [Vibrio harveyi group]ELJ8770222.1 hypothetical protein [Vibrio parahaemolyticus]MBX5361937.1 hypothetical protein [Vibrio parahaemolyticus]MCG9619448.1 hypothetical protein [Vibrio diabolicus]HBC3449604.1 hypothetical protein [Vibrio parahaemolyticus]HCE1624429.1 hypothetical protein [Vibrio parahaemolyticus]
MQYGTNLMQVLSYNDIEQLIKYLQKTLIEEQNKSAVLDYLEAELYVLLDERDYDSSAFDSILQLNESHSYESHHLRALIRAFFVILFDSLGLETMLD